MTVPNSKSDSGVSTDTDWFALACKILAPGTEHYSTSVTALSWDSYDRLELHGWEERHWWVDSDGRAVPRGTPEARLHEHRERLLLDGSRVTCYPPVSGERPAMRLCLECVGRGWTLVTDEDGDPHQAECVPCDGGGYVPRPFAPLPGGLSLEDFFGGLSKAEVDALDLKPGF